MILLCACENYLDLTPKGVTLLDNLTEIEYLLNGDYKNSAYEFEDLYIITNDSYGKMANPSTVLANNVGLAYALMAYDESVDRYAYTSSNQQYNAYYSNINRMNILLAQLDDLSGDTALKASLAAEAKVLRAYWHYLLVNIFAAQYDAATADEQGGIPYVTDMNLEKVNEKLTLAEVYRLLLEDCSEETINNLPDKAVNILRPGKAMGYALRAKIHLQMKNYPEAFKDVEKALAFNGNIEDRLPVITESLYYYDKEHPSVIFYAEPTVAKAYIITQETAALFEQGDILMKYGKSALTEATETRDNRVWSATAAATYKNGIEGDIYMWQGYSNAKWTSAGITSDQLYYIKAECLIRAGHYQDGLDEVNKVRRFRIDPDDYSDLIAANEQDAMAKLMRAKRIECLFTYNNFFDMKRWNSEEDYKQTITRTVNGKTYATPKAKIQCFNQARIKETSIKVKKGSLSFQWGKVGGASGYDVYISTKPKKGYKKVKSVGKNTTKLTIRKFKGKKINPKKTYYMYVETKKKNGSKVNKSGRLYYWNTKSKNFGYF